jgi:hypothetical protein
MTCRLAPLSGRKRIVAPDGISEALRRGHRTAPAGSAPLPGSWGDSRTDDHAS